MGFYHSFLMGIQVVFLLVLVQWVNGYHHNYAYSKQLEVVYQWKVINFEYHHEKDREHAIHKGEYVPLNVVAYEYNKYKDISFITTPRLKNGVPSTLNTISHKKEHGSPLLKPFPDWEFNKLGNCHGLTSVYTTHVDEQGRLWVLDSGVVVLFPKEPERICPPKIVVFDLKAENKVVATYVFPDKVIDCNSLFVRLAVDQRGPHLDNFWVYISDVLGQHLVVLDTHHKTFTRITQQSFLRDPHQVDFTIGGVRIFLPLGLNSIVLGPLCNGDRKVYYHAYARLEECYVQASTLQNPIYAINERAFPDSFYCFKQRRESNSPLANNYKDVIFYFIEEQTAVKCWNTTRDPYFENTAIVARNEKTLQAVEALKVVGNELYGISTRLQLYLLNEVSSKEINIRLVKANVDYLLNGTPCRECVQNEKESNYKPYYEGGHNVYKSEYEDIRDDYELEYEGKGDDYKIEYEGKRDEYELEHENKRDDYKIEYEGKRDDYESEYEGKRDEYESEYENKRYDYKTEYEGKGDDYKIEYEGKQDEYESEYENKRYDYKTEYEGKRDDYESEYEGKQDEYEPEYKNKQYDYKIEYEGKRDDYESEYEGKRDGYESEYENKRDDYKIEYEGKRDDYKIDYEGKRGDYESEYESKRDDYESKYGSRQDDYKSGYENKRDDYKIDYEGKRGDYESEYESKQDDYESKYGSRQDDYKSEYENKRDDYKIDYEGKRGDYGSEYESKRGDYESKYGSRQDDYKSEYENKRDDYKIDYEGKQGDYGSEYESKRGDYGSEYESKRGDYESEYENKRDDYKGEYEGKRDDYKSEYGSRRDDYEKSYRHERDEEDAHDFKK